MICSQLNTQCDPFKQMDSLNDFTCTITIVEHCLNIFYFDCMHKRESVV